jgi:hypothetical protein
VTGQIDPTITSIFSTVVLGTESATQIFTTIVFATGSASAGAAVGFPLLVAVGWLIMRHLVRISRFMDKFDNARDTPEKPASKEGRSQTRDTELSVLNSSNIGADQTMTELSPQERPQLLEEWGRHGSRGNELPGSYTAHGVSELDSSNVAKNLRVIWAALNLQRPGWLSRE